MPDPNLEAAPTRQADDVRRLLPIGGKRFLDEHMATGLERIHRQSVVRQMRREDRQRLRRLLSQKLTMVGVGGNAARAGRLAFAHGRPVGQGLRRWKIAIGAAGNLHTVEREQAVQVDASGQPAPGDPDSNDRLTHDARIRLVTAFRATLPSKVPR